jgi:hypothetical protein
MQVYAQSLNCNLTGPVYVAPFILPLLLSLMVLPLTNAAVVFAILNILMIIHITRILLGDRHTCERMRNPLGYTLLLFSPATAACLAYGQFGILCTWIIVVASRTALRRAPTLPIVLALAALKPHLGFIYWLGLFADIIRTRRIGTCFATGGIVIILTALVEVLTPGAVASWLNGTGSALTWTAASPITFIRMAFRMPNSPLPVWPVLLGFVLAIGYAVWHLAHRGRWFNQEKDLALFTALSLCSIPYLWCLDFPVLLIAELLVFADCGSTLTLHWRQKLGASVLMLARFALTMQMVFDMSDYRTGWYPLAILLALLIVDPTRESDFTASKAVISPPLSEHPSDSQPD